MATRDSRKGGAFGWLLIGILVGAALVVGGYLYVTRQAPPAPVVAPIAPAAPIAPIDGPPPLVEPAAPPANPAPAAPPPTELTDEDRQIADDAAATGMTGSYTPPPQ